jgi:hypothetical protein
MCKKYEHDPFMHNKLSEFRHSSDDEHADSLVFLFTHSPLSQYMFELQLKFGNRENK